MNYSYRFSKMNRVLASVETPINPCKFVSETATLSRNLNCDKGSISLVYHRNDRLFIDGDSRFDCSGVFTETNWFHELNSTSLIFLNRGAHYENDLNYLDGWLNAIRKIHEAAPGIKIIARTTISGHLGCEKATEPVPIPSNITNFGHWDKFSHQNLLLRNLIHHSFSSVILLDMEYIASLRPDSHVGIKKMVVNGTETFKIDCLHFGSNNSGGIFYAHDELFYNILLLNKKKSHDNGSE